eukprot:gene1841-biopygen3360
MDYDRFAQGWSDGTAELRGGGDCLGAHAPGHTRRRQGGPALGARRARAARAIQVPEDRMRNHVRAGCAGAQRASVYPRARGEHRRWAPEALWTSCSTRGQRQRPCDYFAGLATARRRSLDLPLLPSFGGAGGAHLRVGTPTCTHTWTLGLILRLPDSRALGLSDPDSDSRSQTQTLGLRPCAAGNDSQPDSESDPFSPERQSWGRSCMPRGDPLQHLYRPKRNKGDLRGHRTVAWAWRRHGAGVARARSNFWFGVARARRGHGVGAALACPVTPGRADELDGAARAGELGDVLTTGTAGAGMPRRPPTRRRSTPGTHGTLTRPAAGTSREAVRAPPWRSWTRSGRGPHAAWRARWRRAARRPGAAPPGAIG